MLHLSIKNILSNKIRYLLTGLTITLGVCFVVVSFGLSDSIRQAFSSEVDQEFSGVDLVVAADDGVVGGADMQNTAPISAKDLSVMKETPGVSTVEGSVVTSGNKITSWSDKPLLGEVEGVSWSASSVFDRSVIVEGTEPGPDEFLLDSALASEIGLKVGDSVTFENDGLYPLKLSGLVEDRQIDGTTKPIEVEGDVEGTLLMDEATVHQLAGSTPGTYTSVLASTDGETPIADVESSISAVLGEELQVLNIQDIKNEIQAELDRAVTIFQRVLLGFALISVAVSAFIIYNTFSMLLTQRMREIGLLRAIGAGSAQLRTSVIAEAAVVGLLASIVGVGFGLLLLSVFLSSIGQSLGAGSDLSLVLTPRTFAIAVVSGVATTVVAALAPAIRASRVSPVVAMAGLVGKTGADMRARLTLGAMFVVAGMGSGSFGLFADARMAISITAMVVGAVGVFVGTIFIGPFLAIKATKILGFPANKIFGLSGQLAAESAGRSPKRTATTSAALMIGLTLVTTTLIVGESVKSQVGETIERRIQADFAISPIEGPLDATAVAAVDNLEESGTVMKAAPWEYVGFEVDGETEELVLEPVEISNLEELFDLDLASGSVPVDAGPSVVVPKADATRYDLAVGDSVEIDVGKPATVTVSGIYQDVLIFSGWVIDTDSLRAIEPTYEPKVEWVALGVADGSSVEEARAALTSALKGEANAEIDDRASFNEDVGSKIDRLLAVISALLMLSVLIAFIGIGLTLALSVFERTREYGLLRAVGMSRRQMRRMIQVEAMIIAFFGAMLGLAIGLLFGIGAVTALPKEFATSVSLPLGRLAILTLTAAIVGLIAAVLPARRAARMEVLEAISVE